MSKKKNQRGRPCALTPEIQAKFCALISNSSHFCTACEAIRVPETTVRNWLRLGTEELKSDGTVKRKAREPWADFAAAYKEANATAELLLLDQVKKGGWKGAAWILARRYGERWREQKSVELTGAGGSPIMPPQPAIILVTNGTDKPVPWIHEKDAPAA